MKNLSTLVFLTGLCLLSVTLVFGQEPPNISEVYENYSEAAREVVYLHLNKSKYIKGETVGFTAYVLDKKDKKPSGLTTNLYVTIEDENRNIKQKKLIRVIDGFASNTLDIDSTYTSGYYEIKAFTNYMLNFKENNYFSESIRVIDPEVETYEKEVTSIEDYDIQFLPESGHLLHGIENNVGVVVKDKNGYGTAYAEGRVFNAQNELLSSFKTNAFGIGKFPLIANINQNYNVQIEFNNTEKMIPLGIPVEQQGIVLTTNRRGDNLYVTAITNTETLQYIKEKRHTLLIHNGDSFEVMDLYFTDDKKVTKVIDLNQAPSGANIITLFNENDQPIAERLFFNYNGIKQLKSNGIAAKKVGDSITVTLAYDNVDTSQPHNVSISVLPSATKSYNRHHNLLSHTLLKPYVKGQIEQGRYYFTNIDNAKMFELDNLLLTQGWSSYDWNYIFNFENDLSYTFEQGIRVKANLSSNQAKNNNSFLLHSVEAEPRTFDTGENQEAFMMDNLFPTQSKIYMSKVTKNNGLIPASLYLQYFPRTIPNFLQKSNALHPKPNYAVEANMQDYENLSFNDLRENVQQLDEIVVKSKLEKKRERIAQISRGQFGRVAVIDEEDRLLYNTLAQFLVAKGFSVNETGGEFSVTDRYSAIGSTPNNIARGTTGPIFYLDDAQLLDTNILFQYSLVNVDYIVINRRGIGEGARGGRGTIRIYSSIKGSGDYFDEKTVEDFEVPLVFSPQKKYYAPKYPSYTSAFYEAYGVVSWEPQLKINNDGQLSFKIQQPFVPITLYIEGMTNDGKFIVENKTIDLN